MSLTVGAVSEAGGKDQGPRVSHLVCVRQADAFRWPAYLGERLAGKCSMCEAPIYYQAQNAGVEPKVCAWCAGWHG